MSPALTKNHSSTFSAQLFVRIFLGATLTYSVVSKILQFKTTIGEVAQYSVIPDNMSLFVVLLLIIIEACIAVSMFYGKPVFYKYTGIIFISLLSVGSIGVCLDIIIGNYHGCGCNYPILNTTSISPITILRNMGLMGITYWACIKS